MRTKNKLNDKLSNPTPVRSPAPLKLPKHLNVLNQIYQTAKPCVATKITKVPSEPCFLLSALVKPDGWHLTSYNAPMLDAL
ncbi:hypothetical protein CTI12_AA270110 [Artemisia annua]|uniref:Uncharacterized protein n=1 Tax=Artemisia annua TaxID=35608 RepID=A0A2U1NG36_ARTAN|nr:hypothetical protein CTI12_AA270110 [Artemisia annua]